MGFHSAMAEYEEVKAAVQKIEKEEKVPLYHISKFSLSKFSMIKDRLYEKVLNALDSVWEVINKGEIDALKEQKKVDIISEAIAYLSNMKMMFDATK